MTVQTRGGSRRIDAAGAPSDDITHRPFRAGSLRPRRGTRAHVELAA